jgi:hypothetical protein
MKLHSMRWPGAITGTLLLAMAVHAVYDVVVGWQIRRAARRHDSLEAVA